MLAIGILVAAGSHSWLFDSMHAHLAKQFAPNLLDLIQPSLLYTGVILAAVGFLGRRLATRAHGTVLAVATFAMGAAIFPMIVVRWYAPLRLLIESRSSRSLAQAIESSPERDLPIYGYYYFRTGLPFYLRRPVGLVSVEWGQMTSNYEVSRMATQRRIPGSNPGKGILVTPSEFLALSRSSNELILVITPDILVENLWMTVGHVDPLWNQSDVSVWKIPRSGTAGTGSSPGRVAPSPFNLK